VINANDEPKHDGQYHYASNPAEAARMEIRGLRMEIRGLMTKVVLISEFDHHKLVAEITDKQLVGRDLVPILVGKK
jgi:hypothetical protein